MRGRLLWAIAVIAILAVRIEFSWSQDAEFDMGGDLVDVRDSGGKQHPRASRRQNPKFHANEPEDEFDIEQKHKVITDDNSGENHGKRIGHKKHHSTKNAKHSEKRPMQDGKNIKSGGAKRRKQEKERLEEQERQWRYCSDGRRPKEVRDLNETYNQHEMGHMCRELYPTATCCYDHDLTTELAGDKVLEQIPFQCAKMLMKLRCAHCSPRSWWLFHAPDMVRYPHKRVLPIMCRSFCRKFHRLCRDSVAGLEGDDFCDYHTTNEDGPCFPDSFVRRGTID